MKKTKQTQRGFTLLEIMVVIVILGLLVAIVAPNVLENQDRAMVQKAKADVKVLESALKMYKLDNLRYPTQDQGLNALVTKPSTGPQPKGYRDEGYIDRLMTDPWGNAYQYANPGERRTLEVFSFGADGVAGGEGLDADIGNW
ncbi:MAG: type II secretion system major pseudopilin GspG [Marinobacterium sp.]|nr:type II secretion system major pseudopilin GspG [Marinobacterium sp.]